MPGAESGLLKSSSSPKPVLCPRFSLCCLKLEAPVLKTRLNAIVVLNTSCEIDILNERGKKLENTNVIESKTRIYVYNKDETQSMV